MLLTPSNCRMRNATKKREINTPRLVFKNRKENRQAIIVKVSNMKGIIVAIFNPKISITCSGE